MTAKCTCCGMPVDSLRSSPLCNFCAAFGEFFDAQADYNSGDPSKFGSREIAQHTAAKVRRDLREESE